MIVEIFRMMFGRPIPEKPGWPRFAGWVVTFAIAAAGALLLRNATAGRDYPWSQGKVYFAAMLLWLATMRARSGLSRMGLKLDDALGWAISMLNRGLILALCWFPGLALGWYSLEAANRPSRNSRGQDVCDVSAAQFCVSGPRALIPWAILLLVFAGGATYYFIWSWTTGKRRDIERPAPLAGAARQRMETVIPPNDVDPHASSYGDQPVPTLRPTDKDLPQAMADLSALVKMKQAGELSAAEFESLKGEIVRRATDGV